MANEENENKSTDSWLSKKIGVITGVIIALTALTTAIVHFRDSIPWLTPVASIEVVPGPANLDVGDKIQLVATVKDSTGKPLEKRVRWTSANPVVVSIDGDGIVTGKIAGQTTITASVGGIGRPTLVLVRHVNVASVEVFPPSTTLQVDDHLKFDATPYDSDGNPLPGRPVRWASENNSVASVDQSSGETTGKSVGAVKVNVESETRLNAVMVTVNAKPSAPGPPADNPSPAPAPATSPGPPPAAPKLQNRAAARARIGAEVSRVSADRPAVAAAVRLPQTTAIMASASRTLTLALAEKISISNGLRAGDCPASVRILIGDTLIDVKSDPQEASRIPLGDMPYNLHGTVSCSGQSSAVVNGHGTLNIVNGKKYRCAWQRTGPRSFEIVLQAE